MVSGIGTVLGSIFPAILVVVLGVAWLADGNPSQIPFSAGALVPDISFGNLAFLGGIILLFTGMEMAGLPRQGDPRPGTHRARARSSCRVGVIVVFSVLGSLFLAIDHPGEGAQPRLRDDGALPDGRSTSSASGGCSRPLALIVALGGIAHLSPWILGPAKGVGGGRARRRRPRRLGRRTRTGCRSSS